MRIPTLFLRRVHKWIGLLLGVQFLLWAISGTAMALIDMDAVAGGERAATAPPPPLTPNPRAWDRIKGTLGRTSVGGLSLRPLLGRQAVEIATADGIKLFDAATGTAIAIDAGLAARIAAAAHPNGAAIVRTERLERLTLAVREHALPIWRVDFDDAGHSSYYVSGETGQLLERRNDSWRMWDFFWMLHNMDYANRTSFNHPLIIAAGFGTLWLAIAGFLLLFRTAWRPDFRALKRAVARNVR